jgi:hypothetical protein
MALSFMGTFVGQAGILLPAVGARLVGRTPSLAMVRWRVTSRAPDPNYR